MRISITWRSVRALAVHTMSVLRPIGARRRSAEVTSFLTWKGTPSSSIPSSFAALIWNSSSLLDDREHLLADGLERRGDAEADVAETHVAQALLAEGRAGAMPDELVGESTADVAQRERVVRVLEHAAVGGAQDVGEVLALVGANLGDVRVQPGLPAAVAGAAPELDEQLAAVGVAVGLVQAPLQPGLPADVLQVAAHPLDVDRWAGDQEDRGARLVHRADGCYMPASRASRERPRDRLGASGQWGLEAGRTIG